MENLLTEIHVSCLMLNTELWIVEEMVKYISVLNIFVSAFFCGIYLAVGFLCLHLFFVALSSEA